MTALESLQPYVERLFEDDEVSDQLSRAAANLRLARSRAGRAKSKRKAIQDDELRYRLVRGLRAAWAAGVAVQQAPQKQQRKRRRSRLLFVLVAGAGVAIALNEPARTRVMGLVSGSEEQPS
jgi:hypothetical protein